MISRYRLRRPGCEEVFVSRLGVEPTRGTRLYLPCPHCRLPIRGHMSGTKLENHQVHFECEVTRHDVRTDWTVRDDVRAKLRASIKRLIVKNGYPSDKQPAAIRLVMDQMETMAPRYAEELMEVRK